MPARRSSSVSRRMERVSRDSLGIDELRPEQRQAVEAALAGRDVLAVMPTGAGKSAIYQIAGILMPGATVVVSPLIALQRDQITALEERMRDTGGAVAVNSTLSDSAQQDAYDAVQAGEAEFFFVSPEQLAKEEVLDELAEAEVSLFVVDEAHLISSWGHDFRPEYLRLAAAAERLGNPTVIALTATAAPPVREEIAERLALRDPLVLATGFDRPNIHLAAERLPDEDAKRRRVLERVRELAPPGIVYAATRRAAEEVAAMLADEGVRARAYHAGLRGRLRKEVQDEFMDDRLDVVVATTAFGMGIDKPNIRFVIHESIPESLDAYYQEIGRAGRDGEPADATLLYRPEDLGLRRFFASGIPREDALRAVGAAVADGERDVGRLGERLDLAPGRRTRLLNLLEEARFVTAASDGTVRWTRRDATPEEAAAEARRLAEARMRIATSRIEMIRGYAETLDCRRRELLSYFGEQLREPCGNCDRCDEGTAERAPRAERSPFPVGSRVTHAEWGAGTVMRFEGDRVVVLFEEEGYKTLALDIVEREGLLAAADEPAA